MKPFPPTGDRPVRVLLVDDSPLERFIAREALEQAGFDVIEACDGAAALTTFAEQLPDIVLLDVKMPKVDGFECCRSIREREDGADVPILMLTGLDDVESINQAYETGATDFYGKPINAAILTHRVRYLLRSSRTAEELRRSRSQLAHAQRMAGLGYWEWRGTEQDSRWSPEVEAILGRAPVFDDSGPVLGTHVHPDDRLKYDGAIHTVRDGGQAASLEHRIIRADGAVRTVHHEVEAVKAADGTPSALVGVLQDISERRYAEERIRLLAYYDGVTGLPNRTLLGEHLAYAIARAARQNSALAVLFLDLDRFKRINDTHGHSAGDQLLLEVAERLKACIRDCDYIATETDTREAEPLPQFEDHHTVARLGGDEFVIVLPDIRTLEDAARVAQRVHESLSEPFQVIDQVIHVSTSIGISGYPSDGDDVDTLLKHADAAMYHAKSDGRDRFQFFTPEMNERTARRLELETALREAIFGEQLLLHYQPILSLQTGRTIAVEALVRWNRPGHGLISPAEFIPVAEESQLIVSLGEWVLRRACSDTAAMAVDGMEGFRVAVNLSAVQFAAPGLSTAVAEILADSGLNARRLELELTETVLMGDAEKSAAMLAELKRLGVQISIDDFGTGYSSLAYLKRFPIDTLKIDRSFIRDIANDADDASIVTATIGLARSLRLNVVAEGVSEREQLDFLIANDCDRCQGFLLARPMPLGDLREWLRAEQAGASVVTAQRELRVVS